MNKKSEDPRLTISITVATASEADDMEVAIATVMGTRNETRNEVLARALSLGLVMVLRAECEALEREPQVREALRKLKCGEEVSTEDLEMIVVAAKSGHLDAKIVIEDIKRFGRSIEKS